ncbi:MAG: chemotaxis protein CheW, partial [Deltaproteobacteria bacterium]
MDTHAYQQRDPLSKDDLIFATFLLEELEFAIEVTYIQDAIPVPDHIIPLPASPDYIAGIMDLRGTILPIIDTRKRFRIAA